MSTKAKLAMMEIMTAMSLGGELMYETQPIKKNAVKNIENCSFIVRVNKKYIGKNELVINKKDAVKFASYDEAKARGENWQGKVRIIKL